MWLTVKDGVYERVECISRETSVCVGENSSSGNKIATDRQTDRQDTGLGEYERDEGDLVPTGYARSKRSRRAEDCTVLLPLA